MISNFKFIFVQILFIIIGILVFHSCSMENEECSITGQIIDYDGTECLCCPGWIIKTGNDTIKVLNLPIETQIRNIVEVSGFPVAIKLDYKNSTGTCAEYYKEVTCITIID